jgi:foldase protein PrsA
MAAVTVSAPTGATVIDRSDVAHWTRLREDPLGVLIRSAWIEGEARDRNVVVTAGQVRERLRGEPRGGLSRADLVWRTKVRMLEQAMREPLLTAAAQSVTQEQIDSYVQAHPRTDPEQRTLRMVVTDTERDARRAKAALTRGATWRAVGGRRRTVTRDELPARVGRAAFTAERGQLLRVGTYVIKVTAIELEHPTPLKTQNAAAWEILASEAQQNALTAYETALTGKWRPRTICAEDLAAHRDCGNT